MRDYHCPECGSENIVSFKYLYEQGDLRYGPPKKPEPSLLFLGYSFVCCVIFFCLATLLKKNNIIFENVDFYKQSPYLNTFFVVALSSIIFFIWGYFSVFKYRSESIQLRVIDFIKTFVLNTGSSTAIFWGFRWLMNFIGWMDGMSVSSNWAWYVYAIWITLFQGGFISMYIDDCRNVVLQSDTEKWIKSYQCKRCGKRFYYEE